MGKRIGPLRQRCLHKPFDFAVVSWRVRPGAFQDQAQWAEGFSPSSEAVGSALIGVNPPAVDFLFFELSHDSP